MSMQWPAAEPGWWPGVPTPGPLLFFIVMPPQEGKLQPTFLVPTAGLSGRWLLPGAEETGVESWPWRGGVAAGQGGGVERKVRGWGVQASFATPAHSFATSQALDTVTAALPTVPLHQQEAGSWLLLLSLLTLLCPRAIQLCQLLFMTTQMASPLPPRGNAAPTSKTFLIF